MKIAIAVLSLSSLVPMTALADSPKARATENGETRISIDFKDVDVVDVTRLLSEVAGFQLVVDPGISCKLTLKLSEVRWVQALDLALKVCGLGREDDNGVIRVASVAKLTAEHEAERKLEDERKLNRPLLTNTYKLSYARASQMAPLIQKFLSPRGQVIVDERTNTLIVIDVQQ
jgi:type IV pilus assembly protein PilQ